MKVKIKGADDSFTPKEKEAINVYLKFLQQEAPLKVDFEITFLPHRKGGMTTGVRKAHHIIHILAKDRLLIDVMRTLAHEWIHEYQHQKLGLKDTAKIQDIGGPEENMANALAGIYVKKFAKEFPEMTDIIYGEKD